MKSRVAQFIFDLFDREPMPKNPLLGIFYQQLKKLTQLIDENPEYQAKAESMLDYIKENW